MNFDLGQGFMNTQVKTETVQHICIAPTEMLGLQGPLQWLFWKWEYSAEDISWMNITIGCKDYFCYAPRP